MLNVQQITSTLAKLPDQQLQQYAQMHKSDPYIMALAVSESNRRKEMRSAGQGAQGGQEQPKVVDQDIAGMAPPAPQAPQMAQGPHAPQLPEEVGIGRLPAGNMHFAEGGIVAFAGGGTPNSLTGDIPGFVSGSGNNFLTQDGEPVPEPILRKWWRQFSESNAAARQNEINSRVAAGLSAPEPGAAAPAGNPAQDLAQFDAASNLYMTQRAAQQAAAAAAAAGKAPSSPAIQAPPAAGPVGAPVARPVDATGAFLKRFDKQEPEKPLADLVAETKALKPQGQAYAGLEAAYKTEAEDEPEAKKDAMWMAITQAGLAAAAGASPYALKNIAEGFGTGLGAYKDSLKEFKQADKERRKAMADIEQARRAEEIGDVDKAVTLREKGRDRLAQHEDHMMAGVASITGQQIGAKATVQSAQIHAGATKAAIGAAGPQEHLFSTLGGGDVLKGMKAYTESMGTEAKGQEAALQAYIKNPMELKMSNPQLAAQFDALLRQRLAGLNVTDTPSTNLRKQP